ncbi:MAG: ATP-binding protein [Planctomycetes bacterium]|nr:ATP-binding protein [Planctomycetota bacterium]
MGDATPDGSAPQRAIILAVPEDGVFAPIIQSGFTGAGWGAVLVHRAEALAEIAQGPAVALVVLDMALPGAQEVLHALKLNPATNWIPVVAVFPRSVAPLRPTRLRVQADLELGEPLEIHQLIAAAESRAVRSREAPSTRKVCCVLPSRRADLERAVEIAAAFLRHSGLDEVAQTHLLAAVREAIGNAMQHGHRNDPEKHVHLELRQNPATVTVSIRDEGPGFDAEHFMRLALLRDAAKAARERHRAGGQGGLGMLMLIRCTDRIRYSKSGNLVTLTKFIRHRPAY